MPAKSCIEYEDAVVDVELIGKLAPRLFSLDLALSSLLPPVPDFADKVPICNGGNLPLPPAVLPSCGVAFVPIGVARLSFGGACLGISRGGGACRTLLCKGRAFGEAGIARPNFGIREELFPLLPGIGGRNKGAGDAILAGSGGGGVLSSATTGRRVEQPALLLSLSQTCVMSSFKQITG